MELIQGRQKTSKFEPEDVLSNIPDIAITNILDRLSLQDAVRTCVLSRNWRFKWTMLSELVFDDTFFEYLQKRELKNSLVISRILLHLRGVITKFVLSIENKFAYDVLDDEDIHHCILFLSTKGIKDLTLKFRDDTPVKLPTHLFSCLELEHLNLHNCHFQSHPPPNFHGFPNLLSFELRVRFQENSELVKLFTWCPLLEILKLDNFNSHGKVKLVEIAKLKNLKLLSLTSCDFADANIKSSSTIFELLGSLPKLQEFDLCFLLFMLTEDVAQKRFSTAFHSLKTLDLSLVYLDLGTVSCVLELIMSFPNLQTLKITTIGDRRDRHANPSLEARYNTLGPFQLRRMVVKSLNASERQVFLIKCLLACSPFLQRIAICPGSTLSSKEKRMFAKKLLKLPRASTAAKIDFFGI
ncbi:hypothetical protein SSX86_023560 [Deinandra increscens subsp. villosa]|uniref:F-box domain-containing protein n=1 Tax=Deinandra increscens subsp. villosa TaxID=3103831 RepID=A0AAP0CSS2_9ASTR